MSQTSDEDDILKDLVSKTLQNNGVLGKIQAQLRASVFLALEDEFKEKSIPLCNQTSQEILKSPAGALAASLLHDFLSCLGLDFSLSVFGPESSLNGGLWNLQSRNVMSQKLGCSLDGKDDGIPVLVNYCQEICNSINKTSELKVNVESNLNAPKTISSKPSSVEMEYPAVSKSANNTANKILDPISNNPKKKSIPPIPNNDKKNISNNTSPKQIPKSSSTAANKNDVFTSNTSSLTTSTSSNKNVLGDNSILSKLSPSSTNKPLGSLVPFGNKSPNKNNPLEKTILSGKQEPTKNRLPPSNILSEPPMDDFEDSSESSSCADKVNQRQLIKSLISEVENERSNSAVSKKGKKHSNEDDDSSSSSTLSNADDSKSQGDTDGTIQTEEDISFSDIISDGSQKSNNTEDKSESAASNVPDFVENL